MACGSPAVAPTRPEPPVVTPLPAPTGPHPLGVETRRLADTVVRVWYPAVRRGEPAAYARADEELRARATAALGLPPEAIPDPTTIATHAGAMAAPADGAWPVVLFAHGLNGYLAQNTAEVEDLASHGFVVVSVAMPGESASVPWPEGGSLPSDPALVGEIFADGEAAGPHFVAMITAPDRAARDAARAAFDAASPHVAAHGRAWSARLVAVAAALGGLPADDRLRPHLDLAHVGVMGMSFGGGVALDACEAIPACAGSANLDGYVPGAFVGARFTRPHLVFESDTAVGANAWVVERDDVTAWRVHLAGAQHLGLTDLIHLGGDPAMVGTMAAPRVHAILSTWLRAFFEHTLRGGAPVPRTSTDADVAVTYAGG